MDYDLTHAEPVAFVRQVRKGDLRVIVDDQGIWVMPITEVVHHGKRVTITAANPENPAGYCSHRYSKTTHRATTRTVSALGHVYRPFGNLA